MGFPRLLPFERGTTWQGDSITAADGDFGDVVGRRFATKDTENGTSHDVVLRVVQTDTQIDKADFRKGFKFANSSKGDFGSHIVGSTSGFPTTGQFGKPLDDAYSELSTAIVANSVIYVVDEGPCEVQTEASTDDLMTTLGTGVSIGASGLYEITTDQDVISGTLIQIAVSTTRQSTCVVYINGGLDPSPAGNPTS